MREVKTRFKIGDRVRYSPLYNKQLAIPAKVMWLTPRRLAIQCQNGTTRFVSDAALEKLE